jgi:hypothetical protein
MKKKLTGDGKISPLRGKRLRFSIKPDGVCHEQNN